MAEWSKALHSSCNIFGCVGSNPTGSIKTFIFVKCIIFFFFSNMEGNAHVNFFICYLRFIHATRVVVIL